ncbi:hypothetical protein [Algoriphagus aquimarinus]|uniref:Uncharacterized protein n=1 Tax=Algoriphagus aquimarinus TaxID=237018 RepID=A0A1I0VUH0_9BACT|nr:hypothetical protein [Algoriphagus aquimarinus]SFA79326.1 hypothetical protein SAMN04489723_101353 [Algoriphagus aquimarinus]
MKNFQAIISVIIFSICYYSCAPKKIEKNYNIEGNWSTLTLSDSLYTEYFFSEDTLETFNLDWEFLPRAIYEVEKDSVTLKSTVENSVAIKYKISFPDSNKLVLENLNTKLILTKIPDNQYTIDDLIRNGFFKYDYDDPVFDSLKADFIVNVFRIREIRYLIDNEMLNKDTLITLWNSQLLTDSTNQEYYKNLIKEIK